MRIKILGKLLLFTSLLIQQSSCSAIPILSVSSSQQDPNQTAATPDLLVDGDFTTCASAVNSSGDLSYELKMALGTKVTTVYLKLPEHKTTQSNLVGTIEVGDSTKWQLCAKDFSLASGFSGYFSCDEPLEGEFIKITARKSRADSLFALCEVVAWSEFDYMPMALGFDQSSASDYNIAANLRQRFKNSRESGFWSEQANTAGQNEFIKIDFGQVITVDSVFVVTTSTDTFTVYLDSTDSHSSSCGTGSGSGEVACSGTGQYLTIEATVTNTGDSFGIESMAVLVTDDLSVVPCQFISPTIDQLELPVYTVGSYQRSDSFYRKTVQVLPITKPDSCHASVPIITASYGLTSAANRDQLDQVLSLLTGKAGSSVEIDPIDNSLVGEYHFEYMVSIGNSQLVIKDLIFKIKSDGCLVSSFRRTVAPLKDQTYLIGSNQLMLPEQQYTYSNSCGYTLVVYVSQGADYALIEKNQVVIQSSDTKLSGETKTIEVTATLKSEPEEVLTDVQDFDVNFKYCDLALISDHEEDELEIQIGSDESEYLVDFTSNKQCGKLQVDLQVIRHGAQSSSIVLDPDFVTYEKSLLKYEAREEQDVGSYTIQLIPYFLDYPDVEIDLHFQAKVRVKSGRFTVRNVQTKPIFLSDTLFYDKMRVQVLTQDFMSSTEPVEIVRLPSFKSEHHSEVKVKLGQATIFTRYNPSNMTLEVSKPELLEDFSNMTFPIRIELVDTVTNQFTAYTIFLDVFKEQAEKRVIRDDAFFDQFDGPWRKNIKNRADLVKAKISQYNFTGEVKVKFSQPVRLVPIDVDITGQGIQLDTEVLKNYMSIEVDWQNKEFEENNETPPTFDWEYLSFDGDELILKVMFDKGYLVSQSEDLKKDILNITFDDIYFVRRNSDDLPLDPHGKTIQYDIPPQILSDASFGVLNATASILADFQETSSFFVFTNLVMNLPKSLFWSLHNTLELMGYETELGALMPANAVYVFTAIKEKAAFEMIPIDDFIDLLFQYNKELSDEQSALKLAGFYYAVFIFAACLILFLVLLSWLLKKCEYGSSFLSYSINKVKKKLMFSSAIRTYLLGYIQLSVTSFRGMRSQLDFSSGLMTANSIQFVVMFVLTLLTPVVICIFIESMYPAGIKNKTTKNRYGSLFLNLGIDKPNKLYYSMFFVMRRLLMALMIVLLRHNLILQLMLMTSSTLFGLSVLILMHPYFASVFNNVEIMNDWFILVSCTFCLSFSNVVGNPYVRYQIGWIYCYNILALMILNFLVIGRFMGKMICTWIKLRLIKWWRWIHVPMHVWREIERREKEKKKNPFAFAGLGGLNKFLAKAKQDLENEEKKQEEEEEAKEERGFAGTEIIDKAFASISSSFFQTIRMSEAQKQMKKKQAERKKKMLTSLKSGDSGNVTKLLVAGMRDIQRAKSVDIDEDNMAMSFKKRELKKQQTLQAEDPAPDPSNPFAALVALKNAKRKREREAKEVKEKMENRWAPLELSDIDEGSEVEEDSKPLIDISEPCGTILATIEDNSNESQSSSESEVPRKDSPKFNIFGNLGAELLKPKEEDGPDPQPAESDNSRSREHSFQLTKIRNVTDSEDGSPFKSIRSYEATPKAVSNRKETIEEEEQKPDDLSASNSCHYDDARAGSIGSTHDPQRTELQTQDHNTAVDMSLNSQGNSRNQKLQISDEFISQTAPAMVSNQIEQEQQKLIKLQEMSKVSSREVSLLEDETIVRLESEASLDLQRVAPEYDNEQTIEPKDKVSYNKVEPIGESLVENELEDLFKKGKTYKKNKQMQLKMGPLADISRGTSSREVSNRLDNKSSSAAQLYSQSLEEDKSIEKPNFAQSPTRNQLHTMASQSSIADQTDVYNSQTQINQSIESADKLRESSIESSKNNSIESYKAPQLAKRKVFKKDPLVLAHFSPYSSISGKGKTLFKTTHKWENSTAKFDQSYLQNGPDIQINNMRKTIIEGTSSQEGSTLQTPKALLGAIKRAKHSQQSSFEDARDGTRARHTKQSSFADVRPQRGASQDVQSSSSSQYPKFVKNPNDRGDHQGNDSIEQSLSPKLPQKGPKFMSKNVLRRYNLSGHILPSLAPKQTLNTKSRDNMSQYSRFKDLDVSALEEEKTFQQESSVSGSFETPGARSIRQSQRDSKQVLYQSAETHAQSITKPKPKPLNPANNFPSIYDKDQNSSLVLQSITQSIVEDDSLMEDGATLDLLKIKANTKHRHTNSKTHSQPSFKDKQQAAEKLKSMQTYHKQAVAQSSESNQSVDRFPRFKHTRPSGKQFIDQVKLKSLMTMKSQLNHQRQRSNEAVKKQLKPYYQKFM